MRLYFEFLQFCLRIRESLARDFSEDDWINIFEFCKKQSLIGIGFVGINRLSIDQRPNKYLMARWFGLAAQISERNIRLTKLCLDIQKELFENKLFNLILKGQGNLYSYPEELQLYRQSGDIDIWILPRNGVSKSRIIKYVLEHVNPQQRPILLSGLRMHHVDYPCFSDTNVEIHFSPSYFSNPIKNIRLQRWFRDNQNKQIKTETGLIIPDRSFNAVYQLIHIYRHLFTEGIGLRQLLDYYMVLNGIRGSESIKKNIVDHLLHLDMLNFASAVMYVLNRVFALPREFMICDEDAVRGEVLLNEIMLAGNFGFYDERNYPLRNSSKFIRFFKLVNRNISFLKDYPDEVIWDPIVRGANVINRWITIYLFKYHKFD